MRTLDIDTTRLFVMCYLPGWTRQNRLGLSLGWLTGTSPGVSVGPGTTPLSGNNLKLLLPLLIVTRKRLAPFGLSLLVDLAEIEWDRLYRLVGRHAMVFYDAEVAISVTVFSATDVFLSSMK